MKKTLKKILSAPCEPENDTPRSPENGPEAPDRIEWLHAELQAGRQWCTRRLVAQLGASIRTIRRSLRKVEQRYQCEVGFDLDRNTFYLVDPKQKPAPDPQPVKAAFKRKKTVVGFSRLRWIYAELKAGRKWNTVGLVAELGVDERTIRRDFQGLKLEFQQTVAFHETENTFYLVDPDKPLPHVPITHGEFMMFCVGQEALGQNRDTRAGRTLQAGLDKLAASLDTRLEGGLKELTKSICFRTMGGSVAYDAIIFDTIAEALGGRRELTLEYRAHGQEAPQIRRLRPRCLVKQDAAWFLLAHDCQKNQGYPYALARMTNLILSDTVFAPEEGITLRDRLGNSIGIFGGKPEFVRLRVKGIAARLIGEMEMHPSQEMGPMVEEYSELTMKVALNGEFERWVLGWAEEVEVLEPAPLRAKIARRHEEAAAQYRQEPTPPEHPEHAPADNA